jgi:hypothetical protein
MTMKAGAPYESLSSAESLTIWLELCRFDKNDAPGKRMK